MIATGCAPHIAVGGSAQKIPSNRRHAGRSPRAARRLRTRLQAGPRRRRVAATVSSLRANGTQQAAAEVGIITPARRLTGWPPSIGFARHLRRSRRPSGLQSPQASLHLSLGLPLAHPSCRVLCRARRGETGRRTCGRFRAADRHRFPLVSETAGIPRDRCLIMPIPRVSPRTLPCRPSTRQPTLSPS